MTLAEREKRDAEILTDEAMRRRQHQSAEPGAGAAAAGIGDALDRKGGVFGSERVLFQPLGRNFGVVVEVEIADQIWPAAPGRRDPDMDLPATPAPSRRRARRAHAGRKRRSPRHWRRACRRTHAAQCRRSPTIRSPRPCRGARKRCSSGRAPRPHRPRRRQPSWRPRPTPRRDRQVWRHRRCCSWDFPGRAKSAAAGLRMPLRAPSIVPVRLVQWVRAKVAWRRPSGRCLHQRPFNTGRWHGSGVTGGSIRKFCCCSAAP